MDHFRPRSWLTLIPPAPPTLIQVVVVGQVTASRATSGPLGSLSLSGGATGTLPGDPAALEGEITRAAATRVPTARTPAVPAVPSRRRHILPVSMTCHSIVPSW